MSTKHSFRLTSAIQTHPLPGKVLIARRELLGPVDVLLRLLGLVIFSRDRLQMEPRLLDDNIPYVPDLIQLDYTLQPALWVECGVREINRLDKLAVKVHDAEIWVVLPSYAAVDDLTHQMARHKLRRNRYHLLGLDESMMAELTGLLANSNELTLHHLNLREPNLQFEFNSLWFEADFRVEIF